VSFVAFDGVQSYVDVSAAVSNVKFGDFIILVHLRFSLRPSFALP
jgi:hydrogenase maturation factor